MARDDTLPPPDLIERFWRFAADVAGCVRFFSRLPVGTVGPYDNAQVMPDFSHAARALGLAGLVIALPASLALALLGLLGLPSLLTAALALGVLVMTTGAFHEDGLADMADGLGGGLEVADKLTIMKDSRIGSYGAVALVLSLAARLGALAALLSGWGAVTAALCMLACGPMSRGATLWIWYALPAIRPDGASKAAGRPGRGALYTSLGSAIVIVGLVTLPLFGISTFLLAVALPLAAAALLGAFAMRQIGGQTGDILGAGQQIAEIAFYCGLLMWSA